jgi:hypothetical protein
MGIALGLNMTDYVEAGHADQFDDAIFLIAMSDL